MRYPHSLISALLCLTLLFFASADLNAGGNEDIEQLVRPSRTSPIDLAPRGADLTAAQRLARGLPLNVRSEDDPQRHRERDIRSGGTARYTAQIVKRSAAAGDPQTFNIALQKTTTSSSGPVKRDGSSVGWATVVEGQLSYTDSVELAAKFVWASFLEGELRALKWIPDDPQGVYQEGIEYAIGVWSTGFGDVPADAASKFFDQVMDSVFSPTLTSDSDTTATATGFIWVVDSSGQIHFAPDVSTAIAMYPGCSVAIAQTIVPGDPATVNAALGWQSSALTSAGKFYVLGADGTGQWVGVGDDNVFGLTTEASSTTFYFPSLGTSGPQKVLFQQYEQTSTVILADETATSAHLAGMSGAANPAFFNIPTNGKGIVTLDAATSSWTFFSDSSATTTFGLCASSTACGAASSPVCVELVPNGLSPSACAAVVPVVNGAEKWLYATYVIGAKKGWIGVNPDSKALEWAVEGESTTAPAVFVVPKPADDTTQALGIKINGVAEDVRLLQDSRGYPPSLALSSYIADEYSAPNVNILTSSHVTVDSEGFIKTAAGDWFRTFDWLYPLVICDQGNQYCQYAYEPICIEAVDVGGTPSKCLGQMTTNVAKNGRKIYASAEDASMRGWLELDGEVFKPIATRDAASTFYIPGLGNGTAAQELYTSVNGGFNQWWGPYITHNYEYPYLGFGKFGVNPGTGGNQYNVAFNVAASGLGILTPDPNFYWNTFAGMTFYYNPADTLLYLSASDANAQSIGAGLVKVCLEMVDENNQTPPSACGAAQPVKRQLWAEYVDGSGGGWVGYDTDVNGLKWSIPSSPTDTRTFYAPTTPSSSGSDELSVDIGSANSPNKQLVGKTPDFEGRQQLAVTSTSSAATTVFNIPTGSVGIVTPAAGSSFFTAPWYEPLYICPNSGCGDGGPFQQLCLELVTVGQPATACAAQAKAKIEKNPTLLYAATSDGKANAYVRTGADGTLFVDGTTTTATTFYVPGLGNGTTPQDTYASLGGGYGKIWGSGAFDASYNFKGGFTNLRSGYQESAPFEMPVVYPTSSEYGVVSADNSFYTQGWVVVGPLTYFVKYDDHTIHAFASADLAKATLGNNIAALCLESVAEGSEPGQCAATFPRQSGPSYLYATGDGGADSGYVSVNANTGKLTWARSQSTALAATFYASQLGSDKPQELLVKVGDATKPLYAPSGIIPQIGGSSDTTAHPGSLFTIPKSGAGVVVAPSGLGFYTNTAGFFVLGCSDSKCGTSTPYASICIELVPAGSAPSACLAQALAATAKNPVVLYARSGDGSVDGYIQNGSSGLTPYATAADATTFYVPTYGNGSAQHDTYALSSGAYQKIWTVLNKPDTAQRIVGTNKLALGRSAGPAMIPLVYPSSSVVGLVSPYHAFWTGKALYFYVNTASSDHGIYAAPSDTDAAYIGSGVGVVRVCVESVSVGGTPRVCVNGSRKRGPLRLDGTP